MWLLGDLRLQASIFAFPPWSGNPLWSKVRLSSHLWARCALSLWFKVGELCLSTIDMQYICLWLRWSVALTKVTSPLPESKKEKKKKVVERRGQAWNVMLSVYFKRCAHKHTTLSCHLTAVAINAWCYVEVGAWGFAFTWGAANSDKTGGSREKATAGARAGKCSPGVLVGWPSWRSHAKAHIRTHAPVSTT